MRVARLGLALCLAASFLAPALPSGTAGAQAAPSKTIAPTAPGKVHRLKLKSGSELVGRVLSVDSTSIRFESELGVATIAIDGIASFREEQPGYVKGSQYYFPNPNQTRLVFAPTGRMLKRGEGYFTDFWIFFPAFAAGVTDQVTLGGGMTIFPGAGLSNQMYFFTPKIGIVREDRFNAAIGALALSLPGFFDSSTRTSAGVLYGVGTWGGSDHSLTGGVGYGYVDDRLADSPVVMVGGETRVSPRLSLVSENYVFPGGTSLLSLGVRFMARDISVDLSLMRPTTTTDNVTFPLLGFMWKW
jgi:hypothetical protein